MALMSRSTQSVGCPPTPEEEDRLSQEALRQALADAGLPEDAAVVGQSPDPGSRPPPNGVWAIVPFGSQFVVGAAARNKFVPYESLWSFDDAVRLVVRLLTERPAVGCMPVDRHAVKMRGEAVAKAIKERLRAHGGGSAATQVGPRDVLDCVDPDTAHHLYALGTPFSNRSQPPTDLNNPRHLYEVLKPLPETCQEGVAAPWFGQPGGGAMVVLDRPIRWYVDHGYLVEIPTGGGASS